VFSNVRTVLALWWMLFNRNCVGTVLPVPVRQHILSTGAHTIVYSTGIDLCKISVLLSCTYAAHTG